MKTELEEFVQKYDLIQRTFHSFWNCYDIYLQESPEEAKEYQLTDPNSVKIELYGYSFNINQKFGTDYIKVTFEIYHEEKSVAIGEYWCIYDQNGEILDDTFVLN